MRLDPEERGDISDYHTHAFFLRHDDDLLPVYPSPDEYYEL